MPRGLRAFTLLEVMVAMGIVAILALLIFGAVGGLRSRAQRAQCMANLRSLHVAANLHIQEHNQWPQIYVIANQEKTEEEFAELWIAALQPYGIERKTWICPSIQNDAGNPDYTKPENVRIDYIATAFDDKPGTPLEWPEQPWFIERGNMHGKGNLILFANGRVIQSDELILDASGAPPAQR
jgi:prepilin-type N-terminal cleavage/methylation domain-containing protein